MRERESERERVEGGREEGREKRREQEIERVTKHSLHAKRRRHKHGACQDVKTEEG